MSDSTNTNSSQPSGSAPQTTVVIIQPSAAVSSPSGQVPPMPYVVSSPTMVKNGAQKEPSHTKVEKKQ